MIGLVNSVLTCVGLALADVILFAVLYRMVTGKRFDFGVVISGVEVVEPEDDEPEGETGNEDGVETEVEEAGEPAGVATLSTAQPTEADELAALKEQVSELKAVVDTLSAAATKKKTKKAKAETEAAEAEGTAATE